MGFPVVLKIVSPEILHKTEAGGVLVGVDSAEAAKKGFDTIMANAKKYNAKANLLGVQVIKEAKGYRIVMGNLPPQLCDLLPAGDPVQVSFHSPTPEGYHYLGRNHRFVEQL